MAIIMHAAGGDSALDLPKTQQLSHLQKAVGGMIEVVPSTHEGYSIICNEEGKLQGLPVNYKATMLHWHTSDPLCGDVVIIRTNDLN